MARASSRRLEFNMPEISVIIPTFNRRDVLTRVLDRLVGQEGIAAADYELVVVDDGSTDGTPEMLGAYDAGTVPLVTAVQPQNGGPARARNRALELCRGKVGVIVGDDILPPSGFLAQHLAWHRAHPDPEDALLGPVTWPSEPPPTPFMAWLATGGKAFFFTYPAEAGPVAADRFYTCNVSLKRELFDRAGMFDETFRFASHEDIEMGLRLAARGGMRLHYEPEIVAEHEHRLAYESSLQRVYTMGYSSITFWKRVPATPSARSSFVRGLVAAVASVAPTRTLLKSLARATVAAPHAPRRWWVTLSASYWAGAGDARAGRPATSFLAPRPIDTPPRGGPT